MGKRLGALASAAPRKNKGKNGDTTMPSQAYTGKMADGVILLHHLGCGLLVVAFVNLYGLYRLVSQSFGSGFLTLSPLVLPVLFFALFFLRRRRGANNLPPLHVCPVLVGLGCCLAALAVPDPEIAVKRIHVMEYLLLSLSVRYTLAFRLSGTSLLVFSCLLSCLYGVHDEMLQGIHPARTYGLRDMLVNAVAAVGGCLVWHGLALFADPSSQPTQPTGEAGGWSRSRVCSLIGLVAAVPAMTVPLIAHRHDAFPAWPFLPLAAAMVVLSCFFVDDRSPLRHGMVPVGVVAGLFLAYPLAINVLQITFN